MRVFFLKFCFLFYFVSVFGVEPTKELNLLWDQTKSDAQLNSFLSRFPYHHYKICLVEGLGQFYVDSVPDSIKWHLQRGIYWESTIGNLVKEFTQPGTVAIDLGAHIGIHTLTMAKKVGNKGLVIAFEPQWKIFRELYHNVSLNNCSDNVVLLRNAVGDTEGLVEMSIRNPTNEGGTPIGKGGDKAYMVTLDSLNLNQVSLIKMDVESYELKVLEGAKETLLRNKPIIIFEILGGVDLDTCQGNNRENYEAVLQFLTSLGYSIQRIFGNDFIAFP